MEKRKFIVIEGIDGAGKSTITQMLSVMYGNACSVFAEPTMNSPYAQNIREILSGENNTKDQADSDNNQGESNLLELFNKDRVWNVRNNIIPSMEQKKLTILDRYFFSTAAYQGQSPEQVKTIVDENLLNPEIIHPDFVFYLKVDADTAMQRITARKGDLDIFEKKSRLEKIVSNYNYVFNKFDYPFPVFILDGVSDSFDLVHFIVTKIFPVRVEH